MLQSLQKNRIGILLMLCSSVCVCFGQLLWKLGAGNSVLMLCVGFALYGVGAMIMFVAYKFGNLSVLQPMLSMSYIFAILIASFVLGENITLLKIVGIFVITLSVALIGGGDN